MTLSYTDLIAFFAVAIAVGILIHKFWPGSTVAKVEDQVATAVEKFVPSAEVLGMKAITDAEMWLTDTSSKDAAIAKLQAEKAAIIAAARAHVAKVLAALPPV